MAKEKENASSLRSRRSASLDLEATTSKVSRTKKSVPTKPTKTKKKTATVGVADPLLVRQQIQEVTSSRRKFELTSLEEPSSHERVRHRKKAGKETIHPPGPEHASKLFAAWYRSEVSNGTQSLHEDCMACIFYHWMKQAMDTDGAAAEVSLMAHVVSAAQAGKGELTLRLLRACSCAASKERVAAVDVAGICAASKRERLFFRAVGRVIECMEGTVEEEAWREALFTWACICSGCTCSSMSEDEPMEDAIEDLLLRVDGRRAAARLLGARAHGILLRVSHGIGKGLVGDNVRGSVAAVACFTLWVPKRHRDLSGAVLKALEKRQIGLSRSVLQDLSYGAAASSTLDQGQVDEFGGIENVIHELGRAVTPESRSALFMVLQASCHPPHTKRIPGLLDSDFAARVASRAAFLSIEGAFMPLSLACKATEAESLLASCEKVVVEANALPPELAAHPSPSLLQDLLADKNEDEKEIASNLLFHMLRGRVDQGKPALPQWSEHVAEDKAQECTLLQVLKENLTCPCENDSSFAESFSRVLVRVILYIEHGSGKRSSLEEVPVESLIMQAEVFASGVNWLQHCGALNESTASILCKALLDTLLVRKGMEGHPCVHSDLSDASSFLHGSGHVPRPVLDCFPARLLASLLDALPGMSGLGPHDTLRGAMLLLLMGRCSKSDSTFLSSTASCLSTIINLLDDPDSQVAYYASMFFLRRYVQHKPDEFNTLLDRAKEHVRKSGTDPGMLDNPYNLIMTMRDIGIDVST